GLIPISIATWLDPATRRPVAIDVALLAVAGVMMGCGTAAFNYLATSRRMDASVSIPITDTAMLIVSVLGAVLFYAEPVTTRKLLGLVLLVAGIAVLKPE